MKLQKVHAVSVCLAMLIVASSSLGRAAEQCGPLGCRVFITNPIRPVMQQTPVWCWAASLSALFGAFKHPVDQKRIVARYFPPPGITTGPPWVMADALNTKWVDDNGTSFQISSMITDNYSGPMAPHQVNNAMILNAIKNEIPVFYGDKTHAMIIVQADYQMGPFGPQIIAGGALDPYPYSLFPFCPPAPYDCNGPGFRNLQPNELIGMFVAIPSVTYR
jgi:hypothetical protein